MLLLISNFGAENHGLSKLARKHLPSCGSCFLRCAVPGWFLKKNFGSIVHKFDINVNAVLIAVE